MPCVEHHQLRAEVELSPTHSGHLRHTRRVHGGPQPHYSRASSAASEDPALQARGLLGTVVTTVTDITSNTIKSLANLLGLGTDTSSPTPPPSTPTSTSASTSTSTSTDPGNGNAGGNPGGGQSSTTKPSSPLPTPTPAPGAPANGGGGNGNGSNNGNGGNGNGSNNGNGGNSGNNQNPPSPGSGTTSGPAVPPQTTALNNGPSLSTPPTVPNPGADHSSGEGVGNAANQQPSTASTTTSSGDGAGGSSTIPGIMLGADKNAEDDGSLTGNGLTVVSSSAHADVGGDSGGDQGAGGGSGGRTSSTRDSNGNIVPTSTKIATPGIEGGTGGLAAPTRIAVGVVVTFSILGFLATLLVFRRRKIAKREKRRQRWWSRKRRRESQEYSDEKEPPENDNPLVVNAKASTSTAASTAPPVTPTSPHHFIPAPPSPLPMAEVRKGSHLVDYGHMPSSSRGQDRSSVGSLISLASSTRIIVEGSFKTNSEDSHDGSPSAPGSLHHRPHIRPPLKAAIDRTSAYSGQPRSPSSSRPASLGSIPEGDRAYSDESGGSRRSDLAVHPSHSPNIFTNPDMYDLPRHAVTSSISSTQDSWSPPTRRDSSSIPSPSRYTRLSSSTGGTGGTSDSLRHILAVTDRSSSPNPFDDPAMYNLPQHQQRHHRTTVYSMSSTAESGDASIIASSCYENFNDEEFEKVGVPFIGNLSDELSLTRGDEVRVLKTYEDGWALVERSVKDGKNDAERGLIPVACLGGLELSGSVRVEGGRNYPPRVDSYTTSSAHVRS
ncbi:hypothetical protein D9611_010265 [Ephemerocybe angulata]|uniref:SH3 domain-containing protein n=1 Tax=Ephemerocybe angulata TaxID=980116 RepID=A0A8H5BBC4_9AGAR|nr:hypothetical protein D9611_010265 [Tulosesus angulatus]